MQIAINILFSACNLLLIALGFALIYRVVRFFHFAHACTIAIGAYAAYTTSTLLGLPLIVALVSGPIVAAAFSAMLEFGVYRPLRRKSASPLVLLLASLGAYIVFQNLLSILFGDSTKLLGISSSGGIVLADARLTVVQVWTMGVAVAATACVAFFLYGTKMGRASRAVASQPFLAEAIGLNPDRIILLTLLLGSTLGGLSGTLLALDVGMTPTMGMTPLMMGVVVVIISGEQGVTRLVLASLGLAICQHLTSWQFGSQWQDTATFLVLLVYLLCKNVRTLWNTRFTS